MTTVDTARFDPPETTNLPVAGGTQRPASLVGIARASELTITGRPIRADEAQRIGPGTHALVHKRSPQVKGR